MKIQSSTSSRRHHGFQPVEAIPRFQLNLAEREFQETMENVGFHLIHECDRPGIELRVLRFLSQAYGPTTNGLANQMGLDPRAVAFHLAGLKRDSRVWSQPKHGEETWYITQAGRHFLARHSQSLAAALA